MSESHILNEEIVLEDMPFDFVEYAVSSWREWIGRTMTELEKVQVKEIKLLSYFSIIDMMAQEYFNFPAKGLQDFFTQFVLKFQDKYNYLGLTDPVTLYYRVENVISSHLTLNSLEDGEIYYPHTTVIREKVNEINKILETTKGTEYANKKLNEHRYVDLLYRMRCRLSHEFSAHHMSCNERTREPYYINCARKFVDKSIIVEDTVWQLLFPISFVKDLCLNCFDNYLNYCLTERVPPNTNNGIGRFCELSWYNR